jgi:hypothetical protein
MEENGVFRFFVEPGTELYGEMTNAAFPDLTLRTNNIYIDAKATMPDPNITFVSENAGSLSFIANNSKLARCMSIGAMAFLLLSMFRLAATSFQQTLIQPTTL